MSCNYHMWLYQNIKLLDTWFNKKRVKREKRKKKKKTIKAYQNFDNDTTSIVGKSLTITSVGHMSSLKISELRHLWTACVVNFVYLLWLILVSLDLSRRDLSNNTSGVIIEVLVCLLYLFFRCSISLLIICEEREEKKKT
jgi:hypothetical protein